MAPKRSSSRKLQVTKTKKVVKETVKVSFVDGDEKGAGGETESVQNEQETEELVTSIPIEEVAGHITVQIPVEEVQTPKAPETPADKTEEKKKKKTAEGEDGDEEGSETEEDKTEQEKTGEEEEEAPETEQPEKKDEGKFSERELKKEKVLKGKTVPDRGTKQKIDDTGKKPVKRRRKRRYAAANDTGGEGYKRYVFKVLKQVHPELAISSKAMSVINTFMGDMFERICDEAAKLSQYTNRMTLSSREIQDAVRLVLPGELGRHAVAEGAKALSNYMTYGGKKPKK